MIALLHHNTPFPPIERATKRPNGLLATGADLSPHRLLDAYRHGIFPWFGEDEPILWWSPDPRMVLFVDEAHISKSLRRTLNRRLFDVRINTAFAEVMQHCAEPRAKQNGTWITDEMRDAYAQLHRMGHAYSFETWCDGELVGGLYGVQIEHMFYGESMFTRVPDASKVALVHLIAYCKTQSIPLIDCQQDTPHMASLGARAIPRAEFKEWLERLTTTPDAPQ